MRNTSNSKSFSKIFFISQNNFIPISTKDLHRMSKISSKKKFKDPNSFQPLSEIVPPKKLIKNIGRHRIETPSSRTIFFLIKRIYAGVWERVAFNDYLTPRKIKESLNSAKVIKGILFTFGFLGNSPPMSQLKVFKAFKRLSLLQAISLCLIYNFKVSDRGLDFLSNCLKGLKFLKELVLKFHNSWGLSDVGLESFSICLKRFTLLQKIHVDFSSCRNITNTGLLQVSKSLKKLTSLQDVHNDFAYYSNITDLGIQGLASNLKGLLFLRRLELFFSRCQITDQGLGCLSKTIEKIVHLRKVHLNFYMCSGTTKAGQQKLDQTLMRHPSLQNCYRLF